MPNCFPNWLIPVCSCQQHVRVPIRHILANMHRLQTFNYCQTSGYKMMSSCGFNVYFTDHSCFLSKKEKYLLSTWKMRVFFSFPWRFVGVLCQIPFHLYVLLISSSLKLKFSLLLVFVDKQKFFILMKQINHLSL